ncbi:hypothetical protein QTO34_017792 [Cnephaeus nilssonii]|uniref:Uncharacterized protein n=1 Tax=Cnephaeus nilssonii TaxID=3371016 RepID=A0AA40LPF5_CNENI|nr:hypothetical protein QTO34_017792 [Eptesicus nilssonii]
MASGILVNIKKEVTCPSCLNLLKNNNTRILECGHSFCQACITANNRESMVSPEEVAALCAGSVTKPENLRLSRPVANIVEALREVQLSPQEAQKSYLCEHHGEKLQLFCKEHGKVMCWLCEPSQEHRGHHMFLMEEIVQLGEHELQEALDTLRAEQKETEKLIADFEEDTTSWKKTYVQDCRKQLREIHDSEEQTELQKLEKAEGDHLDELLRLRACCSITGNRCEISSQTWSIRCRAQQ